MRKIAQSFLRARIKSVEVSLIRMCEADVFINITKMDQVRLFLYAICLILLVYLSI